MYKIKFWGKVTDYSIWHGNQQLTTRYRLQTSSIRQKIAEDKNNGHDDLPCVDTCRALRYANMYSTGEGRGVEEGWNTDEDCRLTGTGFLAYVHFDVCIFPLSCKPEDLLFSPNSFMIYTYRNTTRYNFIRINVSTSPPYLSNHFSLQWAASFGASAAYIFQQN